MGSENLHFQPVTFFNIFWISVKSRRKKGKVFCWQAKARPSVLRDSSAVGPRPLVLGLCDTILEAEASALASNRWPVGPISTSKSSKVVSRDVSRLEHCIPLCENVRVGSYVLRVLACPRPASNKPSQGSRLFETRPTRPHWPALHALQHAISAHRETERQSK